MVGPEAVDDIAINTSVHHKSRQTIDAILKKTLQKNTFTMLMMFLVRNKNSTNH